MLKHVAKVKNTGQRCIVVFREIYDEAGHVLDGFNCLVVETGSLPDAEHQDIMRILESNAAQSTGDIYNVLVRERMSNGFTALDWLNKSGRLRKYQTSNVVMTPDANTSLGLDQLNKIVKMQNTGASEEMISNALLDDTDSAPRVSQTATDAAVAPLDTNVTVDTQIAEATVQAGKDGVPLDDLSIAKSCISQAEMFELEASKLRERAIKLDPKLDTKPKRKPGRPKKKTA